MFNLMDLFAIDDTNLSHEMAQQASVYGYFTVLATIAEDVASKASFEVSVDEAGADLNYRDSAGEKKLTEGAIRAMVTSDEKHIQKCEVELLTKYDHKLLKAIVSALDQRASMLVSLGAWMRHEYDQTSMNTKTRQMESAVDNVKAVIQERKIARREAK